MKGLSIICMAVLVLHVVAAHGRKSHATLRQPICYNQNGILMPMRGSCSGFFICVNGNAIASSCGDYFHFNARTGYCDHPERAACFEPQPPHVIEQESVEQQQAPPQIEEPNMYVNIMPMLHTIAAPSAVVAPPPLDKPIPRPQHPDEVVADLTAGPICQKQRNGVQLPRVGGRACSQFYVCIMQRPYRRTCADFNQFSVAHGTCVVPALAQCNEQELESEEKDAKEEEPMLDQTQSAPTPFLNISTSPLPPLMLRPINKAPQHLSSSLSCAGVAPGSLQPHPTDCGKFLSCSSRGRAFEMHCPPGLHFSASQRHCDWPQNAKCTHNSLK